MLGLFSQYFSYLFTINTSKWYNYHFKDIISHPNTAITRHNGLKKRVSRWANAVELTRLKNPTYRRSPTDRKRNSEGMSQLMAVLDQPGNAKPMIPP